jgi:hypothetical protein
MNGEHPRGSEFLFSGKKQIEVQQKLLITPSTPPQPASGAQMEMPGLSRCPIIGGDRLVIFLELGLGNDRVV